MLPCFAPVHNEWWMWHGKFAGVFSFLFIKVALVLKNINTLRTSVSCLKPVSFPQLDSQKLRVYFQFFKCNLSFTLLSKQLKKFPSTVSPTFLVTTNLKYFNLFWSSKYLAQKTISHHWWRQVHPHFQSQCFEKFVTMHRVSTQSPASWGSMSNGKREGKR